MAGGKDERHNPNRKVSKKVERDLREMAWFKWQVSGQVGMGGKDNVEMNDAIESHYQDLLNEHYNSKGQ